MYQVENEEQKFCALCKIEYQSKMLQMKSYAITYFIFANLKVSMLVAILKKGRGLSTCFEFSFELKTLCILLLY